MIYFWFKNIVLSIGVVILMVTAHFPNKQWFAFLSNSSLLILTGIIVFVAYAYFYKKEDKEYDKNYKWFGKLLLLVVIVLSIIVCEQLGGEPTIFATNSNLFYLLVGVGLLELFISGQKQFANKKTS